MKKLFSVMAMAMLILSVMPVVLGTDVGVGVGVEIITEDYAPNIWACGARTVLDDNTQPGRDNDSTLEERENNYFFEGEQIVTNVLVKDKNGIQKISDVFATLGDVQGAGNDIEVNCVREVGIPGNLGTAVNGGANGENLPAACNARILEETLTTFDASTEAFYTCTFTVETADSHYGEYWYTVEAEDLDGETTTMDENEYWFLNPVIALSIDGDLTFDDVRPGTSSYSQTLLVGNDADDGSGVLLDMFISGTDFYDSASSGAACPTTNQLGLENFRYHATNGAYSSADDLATHASRTLDLENYVSIGYATGFNNPNPFYDRFEILQTAMTGYSAGNVLTPGSELAITFKLNLPEPCNGDFDTGSLNFWGEAI